jgi:hypothetical protein
MTGLAFFTFFANKQPRDGNINLIETVTAAAVPQRTKKIIIA